MIYNSLVVLVGIIFSSGVILVSPIFLGLIQNTTVLVNVLLEDFPDEQVQYTATSARLKQVAKSLFLSVLAIIVVLGLSLIPLLIYAYFMHTTIIQIDTSSAIFWSCFAGGTIIPFVVNSTAGKKKNYSSWSILLHRIILGNSNISLLLFKIEKKLFKKKLFNQRKKFLIISGLARAGTTALTSLLFQSRNFHSLSYANVPFLLAPNLWSFIYKPNDNELRERSHGDRVMFGYNTVEALEEYFWKVLEKDNYILSQSLKCHRVTHQQYDEYMNYQSLIRKTNTSNTLYLAKNNNFILRYTYMREWNKEFVFVILFREPLEHAYSLLRMHQRYVQLQNEDTFIKEYMTWLGHHEFGMNHKPFDFELSSEANYSSDTNHINYWLASWINYYTYVLSLEENDNTMLISYRRFLNEPVKVVNSIAARLGITLHAMKIERFENEKKIDCKADENLLAKANKIYLELVEKEEK